MMFLQRVLLPFLLLSTSLTQGENTKEFINAYYTVSVKIKSSQPRYYYWANDDPTKKYRVAFSKIYETKDGSKVGGSNLALSSMTWIITQDTEASTDSVVFWINGTTTTTTTEKGDQPARFSKLSFRNQIVNDTIKFDVIIDNYNWVDSAADSLDMEWKMTNSTGEESDTDVEPIRKRNLRTEMMGRNLADEVPASESKDLICWYGGGGDSEKQICWKIVDQAVAAFKDRPNGQVPVTMDLDGGFIKVSYENWGPDGSLIHDPEFGFNLDTTDGCAAWGLFAFICNFISFIMNLLGFA